MRILISGICGFVGSTLALRLRETLDAAEVPSSERQLEESDQEAEIIRLDDSAFK